jgi:hypothetical protein
MYVLPEAALNKLLIAVKSCQKDKDAGYHDVIRSTWAKDAKALGIDVKFFVGASFAKYESDEMHLKCLDDYNSLPLKTREICKWVSGKLIDHVYLCDTDTFLIPSKMLESGYEKYDYAGKITKPIGKPFSYSHTGREGQIENFPRCFPWASGGYGYFLSRRAATTVAYEYPTSICEDLWVGQVMGQAQAAGELKIQDHAPNVYSWHHPQHGEIYDVKTLSDWMTKMYQEHK